MLAGFQASTPRMGASPRAAPLGLAQGKDQVAARRQRGAQEEAQRVRGLSLALAHEPLRATPTKASSHHRGRQPPVDAPNEVRALN